MSHFTTVKTKLTSAEYLKKALERMGAKVQQGNFSVTQYGTTEKCELKVDEAIGFQRQKDGTFAMVGDPYHSEYQQLRKYYRREEQFNKDLATNYAIEETKSVLEMQNFFCSENAEAKVGEDGMITMTFENWS